MVSAEDRAEHKRQVDAAVARYQETRSQSFWGWIDARPLPVRLLIVLTGAHLFFVLPTGLVLWLFESRAPEDTDLVFLIVGGGMCYLLLIGMFTWIAVAPERAAAFLARNEASYPLSMPGGVRPSEQDARRARERHTRPRAGLSPPPAGPASDRRPR